MTHSEMIDNKENFKWPNMSGALARQTAKGKVVTDTVKGFSQGSSDLTKDNVYCTTTGGYRFRFPLEAADSLKEGSTVKFRKEESEINGTMVHFFQFVEVAASVASAKPLTAAEKKALAAQA